MCAALFSVELRDTFFSQDAFSIAVVVRLFANEGISSLLQSWAGRGIRTLVRSFPCRSRMVLRSQSP